MPALGLLELKNTLSMLRLFLLRTARDLWRKLPISAKKKQRAKRYVHGVWSLIFGWRAAWRFRPGMVPLKIYDPSHRFCDFSPYVPNTDRYVPITAAPLPRFLPVRLIAFYLPQFHPVPENDDWWGAGFTEWTNVKPAQAQFDGHYQPHVPGELGYYDLCDPAVQHRQVELAKLYGISGFCFYYYWFGGKRLLEKPVDRFLNDRGLDLPFCLCWANENWCRTWDGLDSEILIAQKHSPDDDLAFIQHVARYMRDERYIRVDGKPLLLVYRPSLLPSARETAKRWRNWCRQNGIGEIYLAYTQSFESVDPQDYGFDAAIEFPPNNSSPPKITEKVRPLDPGFGCTVYDWRFFVNRSYNYQKPRYMLFRSVCPSWDNTARRKNRSTVFLGSSPPSYQEWLANAISESCRRIRKPDERLVFVNAWNEWAEGAYLEPDQRYGYAYLDATRKALLAESARRILVVSHDAHPHGAQFLALGMVRSLKQDMHLEVEVVLLGSGRLTSEFAKLAPVHDLSSFDPGAAAVVDRVRSLVERGFTRAIANTTVSGWIVPIFRDAGIESISLIHELPGVIRSNNLESQAGKIASSAKAIVFPAQVVADGFAEFCPVDPAKLIIRPQGLYRRNKWRLEKDVARARLRKQLGLALDSKVVLAVGYADHRKGIDLFVECALKILTRRSDVSFIWVGHWDLGMRKEVDSRLGSSVHKNRFHFVGYDPDTALYHAGSDVYALTSREDPFPNVVLESFDAGVPVVAFASTGGAADLVGKVGGIVVPSQDTDELSCAICRLLDTPGLSSRMGDAARKHLAEHFAFRPYLFDLCAMLGIALPRVSVIVPNYNYARYIEARLFSIRSQSIPIFELIILDDASTDKSLQKISHWLSSTHTDAQVIASRTNSGNVFAQWHHGISLASGDYVWIAEADDLSDPDFLQTVLRPMASKDVVLSYCESKQVDSNGRKLADNYDAYLSLVAPDLRKEPYIGDGIRENCSSLAIMNTIPNVSAVLFRRDVIRKVFVDHFEEIASFKKAGDWVAYFRTLFHGKIAFSPRAANYHRRHKGGVVGAGAEQDLLREIAKVQQLVASNVPISEEVQFKASQYLSKLQSSLNAD
ncbi:MAG TPA: glycoside hydrolase family 99-like domain-containing protein [Ramlibacter sp.]|nr:glycoside hydrolase family 99-like domain-containing protein [Ramlibacter sp.]